MTPKTENLYEILKGGSISKKTKGALTGIFKSEFTTALRHRMNYEGISGNNDEPNLLDFQKAEYHIGRANLIRDILQYLSPKDYDAIMTWSEQFTINAINDFGNNQ